VQVKATPAAKIVHAVALIERVPEYRESKTSAMENRETADHDWKR
jgi:hypothetical protein